MPTMRLSLLCASFYVLSRPDGGIRAPDEAQDVIDMLLAASTLRSRGVRVYNFSSGKKQVPGCLG